MNDDHLPHLLAVARGDEPAELLIANAKIVNVFTREIVEGSVAVADGHIAGIGPYEAKQRVDLEGRYLTPGFIDPHLHIESSMASISEFARGILPSGTTTVVADPHEIANVLGTAGIEYMIQSSEEQPMNVRFTLSSCVPATDMETSGARLTADDMLAFIEHDRILAVAEMMNFPGVVFGDPDVLKKIRYAKQFRKPVDGHSPGLTDKQLQAYIGAGISSDHECTVLEEAREKLRNGMHVMIREGTGAKNLAALMPLVNEEHSRRLMWCTDDRHPHDLIQLGHINSIVRDAIQGGVDPLIAIQMATLNPAEYFRLSDVGAVAPGRRADMLVLSDLESLQIEEVYSCGRLVARQGKMLPEIEKPASVPVPRSMKVDISALDFSVPVQNGRLRVIQLVPQQIVTRKALFEPLVKEGFVESDISRDVLKMAVVERHTGSGNIGIGFVNGFGLKQGALASSVAHDSHNIIVVGTNDADMKAAVVAVVEMGGGLAVVSDTTLRAILPLPIAGLMTDTPIATIRDELDRLMAAAKDMGVVMDDPFMALSFMALPVIPEMKLTDEGLVDVGRFEIVPLFE